MVSQPFLVPNLSCGGRRYRVMSSETVASNGQCPPSRLRTSTGAPRSTGAGNFTFGSQCEPWHRGTTSMHLCILGGEGPPLMCCGKRSGLSGCRVPRKGQQGVLNSSERQGRGGQGDWGTREKFPLGNVFWSRWRSDELASPWLLPWTREPVVRPTRRSSPWKACFLSSRSWPGRLFVESRSYRRVDRWRCRRVQVHVSVSEWFEVSAKGILWRLQAIVRTFVAYHWRFVCCSAGHTFPITRPISEDTRVRTRLGCRCVK